jgi:hypothetical protein
MDRTTGSSVASTCTTSPAATRYTPAMRNTLRRRSSSISCIRLPEPDAIASGIGQACQNAEHHRRSRRLFLAPRITLA